MTWYEILLLLIAGLLLIPIAIVFIRHFPEIAAIDVKHLPEEKQNQVKAIMAEQRLYRKFKKLFSFTKNIFSPLTSLVKTVLKNWRERLGELEKKYKVEALTVKSVTKSSQESLQQKISLLIKSAWEAGGREDYELAEEQFIQVVQLDPKSVEAFEGLGEIYSEQKKYNQAKEVYHYLLKLIRESELDSAHLSSLTTETKAEQKLQLINDEEAKICFQLAEVYEAEGKLDKAEDHYSRALFLEENNPKYLDALLNISIIKKDKSKAHELFFKLKSINPENKKLNEIEEKIAEI